MAKYQLGSNATFTGGQQGLTILKEQVYAYSGGIDIPSNEDRVLLSFTTPDILVKGFLQQARNDKTSAEMSAFVYLNNVLIWFAKMDNGKNPTMAPFSEPLHILIPPNSLLEYKLESGDDSTTNATATFSGRVY